MSDALTHRASTETEGTAGPKTWAQVVAGSPAAAAYLVAKRLLDIVVCLAGVSLCLPIWVLIAAAIKLESRGPLFFRQKRPGLYGRPFTILKFRTMRADAESRLDEVIHLNAKQGDALIRIPKDPRVTRVGRFLRRTSLDETPQLLNVLLGHMSLVGPRPISRPIDDTRAALRVQVQPGITGLWQVRGRKSTDTDYMLEQDMEYLRERSFWLDLQILWRTLPAVIGGNGAA